MNFFIFIISLLFVSRAISSESKKIFLATYNAPPYQYAEGEVIKGVTVSTVQCIFHKLKQDIALDFHPLKRALRELAKNNISGVFPLHSHGQKGMGMQISSPISIEKWYWLTHFLLDNVNDNEAHRDIRSHQMIESTKHYWQFIKFESNYFIFSTEVIATSPKIMEEFNENISSCTPISLQLSQNKKRILQNHLAEFLTQIAEYLPTSEPIMKLSDKFLISDTRGC